MTSSASVYKEHRNALEEDFDPLTYPLMWYNRCDSTYDEIKRQAECALSQQYPHQNYTAVRFPYVIGQDDYTKRLYYYVYHIIKGIPMYIDNLESDLAFIRSDEAGKFLAWMTELDYQGAINGSSIGTVSVDEIVKYVETRTNRKAKLLVEGEPAPYNGTKSYSLCTDLAERLGFTFTTTNSEFFSLLDSFIDLALSE